MSLQQTAPVCGKGSLAGKAGLVNRRNVNDFSTQTYPDELVQYTYAQLLENPLQLVLPEIKRINLLVHETIPNTDQ